MDDVLEVGAIFDGGQGDPELDDLRLVFPWFAITRSRGRWFAHPVWSTDRRDDLEAATKAELVEQMNDAACAYRVSLMTRGQDGWGWQQ